MARPFVANASSAIERWRLRASGHADWLPRAHHASMPTPGERRALIFLASVAALGVGARGWKEWHSATGPGLAGDRAGLARQIEAVDSAIVAGGDRRPGTRIARARRAAADAGKGDPPSAARSHPAPNDESPAPERDVRAIYRFRRQHHDSLPASDPGDRARLRRRSRVSDAASASGPPPGPSPASPSGGGSPARRPDPLDLDVATAEQIEALPWIGRALAMQIVADRVAHGPFGSLAGLQRVPGIGPGTAARLQPFVTFSLPPRLGSTVESWPRARHRRRPGK
jgi:competence protein ComEA